MVQCDKCAKEVYMPFRCNYCGGYFCDEHRLPEFHGCVGAQLNSRPTNREGAEGRRSTDAFFTAPLIRSSRNVFIARELRDLAVSLLLISAIPLMWWGLRRPIVTLGSMGIFAAAFLVHELAHKFAAQRFGYWAEFRLNATGLLITLLSLISPLKIVAPGAVVIYGPLFSREYGKISLAGPLTNIVQAALYMLIGLTTRDPLILLLADIGMNINALLALFNLIPLGLFDGAKIYRWNWRIWAVTVFFAGALFVLTFF